MANISDGIQYFTYLAGHPVHCSLTTYTAANKLGYTCQSTIYLKYEKYIHIFGNYENLIQSTVY